MDYKDLAAEISKDCIVTQALARMIEQIVAEIHESKVKPLREALRFYQRREHWMGVSENAEASTLLIATQGNLPMDGWSVADAALT